MLPSVDFGRVGDLTRHSAHPAMNLREEVGLYDMSDRKVVLKMVMSLDGFATSPDGTHEWMFEFFGDDSGDWNRRALDDAGVHAMGRRSYEIMGPHWAASEGPIASAMNEKPKAVFSTPWRRRNGDRPRSSAGTCARRSRP